MLTISNHRCARTGSLPPAGVPPRASSDGGMEVLDDGVPHAMAY